MATRELVSRDLRRLDLGEGPVDYVLVRRRGRRGVGLKVDETGLTVSASATMPLAHIEALVRDSERWIARRLADWGARQVPAASWADGALLPFLGGHLRLRLHAASRPRAEQRDAELHVATRTGTPDEIRRAVVAWYKAEARVLLGERLSVAARRAGLAPPGLSLSSALARWGSCNTKREVRLAWRLVKVSPELVDYVISHELAHLRHMNHSAAFWAEVERQCPGHRELRKRLFATDHLYRSF